MRDELYADSRDELKWTVATNTATANSQSVRWVAMYRVDVGQHGNGVDGVPNASPIVTQFFQQERQMFQAGTQPSLPRIVPLCQQLGITIDMNLNPYPASVNRRRLYIEQEIAFLTGRHPDRRDFVLFDPDNGIGRSPNRGEQLHESHVPLIWHALRTGDTLGVVQFQHHEEDWINRRRQNLGQLIGIPPQQVSSNHWNNVCLYTVDR